MRDTLVKAQSFWYYEREIFDKGVLTCLKS